MRFIHVTDGNSVETILKEGLVPKVGPRTQKCADRLAVYLFKNRDFAFDAVCGWLGDCFPDDTELFCLEVELPADFPVEEDPNFGEVEAFSRYPIPAKHLISCTPL